MFSKIFANFGVSMLTHSALQHLFRSSPSEVFLGKGVLKVCSKLTGEHPCRGTNKMMVFLQSKFLQACYSSGPHIMSVLKLVHTSQGSHEKVIYTNFFLMPTTLTKFESCSTWQNLRYQVWFLFCVSSVSRLHDSRDNDLGVCF